MYNNYFGFTEAPFNLTPNSRFYFATNACDETVRIVQHGILSRKGVIVVTGEAGTGKTLLVKSLEHDLAPAVKAVVVQNPHADFDAMLEVLLGRLGLHSANDCRSARLDQLTCHLIEQRSVGVVVCLLIDEAQDLDAHALDEIRLLANLEFQGDALLPIVLIGQRELSLKLDHPCAARIKQRIALTRTTHRLIRMEVEPYIHSRLQVAGYQGTGLFDPEAIEVIAAYSRGIPRLVNSLCDNALLRGYALKETVISAEIVEQAARDLRLTGAFQPGRQTTRPKLENMSPLSMAAGSVTDSEQPMGDSPKRPTPEFKGAPLDHGQPQPAGFPEIGMTGVAPDFPPHLAPNTMTLEGGAAKLSDTSAELPKLKTRTEIFQKAFPTRLQWYGVATVVVLALALLNIVGAARLAVTNPAKSAPQNPSADDGWSHAGHGGREQHQGFGEALFVSHLNLASQRIHIPDPRPREDSGGLRASAPRGANGKANGPGKDHSSLLPRDEEPRRAETGDSRAAGANRNDDAPRTVRVFADSLLRKRPSASAEIISTLEAGSRVTVLAKAGDFYQIRSLDKNPIRGYVHREDAFFERRK